MKGSLGDKQRILHILDAIEEIESYTAGCDLLEFRTNSMLRFATIKQIEIIGEAAKNIGETTKRNYPTIEWGQISALRNILIHEYFSVDITLVWQIVQVDIPELKNKLKSNIKGSSTGTT